MMRYKLFVDDIRNPPDDSWVVVRSYDEAVGMVSRNGIAFEMSLDHDLGEGPTVHEFVKWLVNHVLDGNDEFPSDFSYHVHSANPVGILNIRGLLDGFLSHLEGQS